MSARSSSRAGRRYHLLWTAAPAGWFKRGYHLEVWLASTPAGRAPRSEDSTLGARWLAPPRPRHAARVTGEEIMLSSDRKSAHTTRGFGAETRHGARTPW